MPVPRLGFKHLSIQLSFDFHEIAIWEQFATTLNLNIFSTQFRKWTEPSSVKSEIGYHGSTRFNPGVYTRFTIVAAISSAYCGLFSCHSLFLNWFCLAPMPSPRRAFSTAQHFTLLQRGQTRSQKHAPQVWGTLPRKCQWPSPLFAASPTSLDASAALRPKNHYTCLIIFTYFTVYGAL